LAVTWSLPATLGGQVRWQSYLAAIRRWMQNLVRRRLHGGGESSRAGACHLAI